MASVDWMKYKTVADVKARLRHNCQDTRENTKQHQNPHINKALTNQNTGVWTEYKEARERFEKRLAEVTDGKTVRKDAVRGVGFNIPAPEGLTPDKEDAWFARALDIMGERYGLENICCYTIHRDEVHDYYDTEKQAWCKSRVHAQGILVPEVDGSLCAKKVTARGRMMALNEAIDQMSRDEFGLAFMDGTKRKSRGSTEKLKAESLKAEIEELEQKKADLEKQKASLTREIEGKQITLNAVNRDIATGTATRDALIADLGAIASKARKKAPEAEKPFTEDDRAVIGEVRRRRTKMKNGKEMPTYDYYLDAARQREQAERQKEQEERERIARQAAEERQRQEKQAEYIKRYSGFAKKRQDTTPAGRKVPDISHITQRGDSYDGPEF